MRKALRIFLIFIVSLALVLPAAPQVAFAAAGSDATLSYVDLVHWDNNTSADVDNYECTVTATVYENDQFVYIGTNNNASFVIKDSAGYEIYYDNGVSLYLNPGENIYTINVTSEDGAATNTYTMTLTRLLSNDATISSAGLVFSNDTGIEGVIDNDECTVTATVHEASPRLIIYTENHATFVVKDSTDNDISYYNYITLNLSAGENTYTIYVTAEDGITTKTYTMTWILEWTPVGISCTKTDVTTYNGTDGSITVTASGGDSDTYEYSINEGAWQSSNVFSNLAPGTYTAAVRDAVNTSNTASASVTIGQPPLSAYPANKLPSKVSAGTALAIIPPAPPKNYSVTSVTYRSSNTIIATVDTNGIVTFLTGGKVTITTTMESQTTDKKGKVINKTTVIEQTITVK